MGQEHRVVIIQTNLPFSKAPNKSRDPCVAFALHQSPCPGLDGIGDGLAALWLYEIPGLRAAMEVFSFSFSLP